MTRLNNIIRMASVLALLGSVSILPAQEPKKAQVAPLPKELVFDLGNGVKLEMVRIPRGSYRMLTDPQSGRIGFKVTLENDFYLGKYEITREQWYALMEMDEKVKEINKLPMQIQDLNECRKFIERLNDKVETKDGVFRAPNEVEWEYACRAGRKSKLPYDPGEDRGEFEWNEDNSGRKPHEVGTKKPNPFGLYDMYGNVWESCDNRTAPWPYIRSDVPVLRGGGFAPLSNERNSIEVIRILGIPISLTTQIVHAGLRVTFIPKQAKSANLEPQKTILIPKELTFDLGSGEKLTTVILPDEISIMGSVPAERKEARADNPREVNPRDFDMRLDDERFENEGPPRDVTVSKGLSIGKFEVTRGQFRQFVESEKYQTEAELDEEGGLGWEEETKQFKKDKRYTWKNPGFEQGDDHPVVNVSWNDAVKFCEWLSKKHGKQFRLPTEAEWEYACRAETVSRFSCCASVEELAKIGNIADATAKEKFIRWNDAINAKDGFVFTAPVGRYQPNQYGLYDMHGNVWEWCQDWYGRYETDKMQEPVIPMTGTYKMFRGGSWSSFPVFCRAAFRGYRIPSERSNALGFRVVLEPDTK
jgi:formylglycine-generating enzyme required for sulfatase activity